MHVWTDAGVFVLQVLCNILAADGVNDPDVLAINGGVSGSALCVCVRVRVCVRESVCVCVFESVCV